MGTGDVNSYFEGSTVVLWTFSANGFNGPTFLITKGFGNDFVGGGKN